MPGFKVVTQGMPGAVGWVYSLPVAAGTNHHKPRGLRQQKWMFLQLQRPEVQNESSRAKTKSLGMLVPSGSSRGGSVLASPSSGGCCHSLVCSCFTLLLACAAMSPFSKVNPPSALLLPGHLWSQLGSHWIIIFTLIKSGKSLLSYKRACTVSGIRTGIPLGTIQVTVIEDLFELGPYSGSDSAEGKWDDMCTLCLRTQGEYWHDPRARRQRRDVGPTQVAPNHSLG